MPRAEVLLWSRLRSRQLLGCKFRRQYSVRPYVLDFYSAEIKLSIELDGESHFTPGAKERDDRRNNYIESFGIRIVRFLNSDVCENMDGVLERLAHIVNCRRNELGRLEPAARLPPRPPLRKGGSKKSSPVERGSRFPFSRATLPSQSLLTTSSVCCARSTPARGPLSNSTYTCTRSPGDRRGTRTEAGQKVPQANPEDASSCLPPSGPASTILAWGPAVPAEMIGLSRPRYTEVTSKPSPV